jgi:hypothetical protein
VSVSDELGGLILVSALAHLNPDGVGLFVVPLRFFNAQLSVLRHFPSLGISVEAAFLLPSVYLGTPVEAPASIEEPGGPVAIASSEGPVERFPTPEELWAATFAKPDNWRDRFAQVLYEDKSGKWEVRYYQDTAVQRVLDAVAEGRPRILLTLATGTGKTAIAFQIAWKLFQARWNLGGKPTRRPRILFLADRNILADQAYNEFSGFAENARTRIPELHGSGREQAGWGVCRGIASAEVG